MPEDPNISPLAPHDPNDRNSVDEQKVEEVDKSPEAIINFEYGHFKVESESKNIIEAQFYQEAFNTLSVAIAWCEQANFDDKDNLNFVSLEEKLTQINELINEYGRVKAGIVEGDGEISPQEGLVLIQNKRKELVDSLGIKWPPGNVETTKIGYKDGALYAETALLSQLTHDAKNNLNIPIGYVSLYNRTSELDSKEKALFAMRSFPIEIFKTVEEVLKAKVSTSISGPEIDKFLGHLNKYSLEIVLYMQAGKDETLLDIVDQTTISVDKSEFPIDDLSTDFSINPHLYKSLIENIGQNCVKAYLARGASTAEGLHIGIDFQVEALEEGNYLIISIVDNGIGLPTGVDELGFEEEGISDWGEETKVKGTGHGMFALKKLISESGASVVVRRRADEQEGAQTVIRIPIIKN